MATIKQILNNVFSPNTTAAGRASAGSAFTNQMGVGGSTGFNLNKPLSGYVGQGLTPTQTQKAYSVIKPASQSNPKPTTAYGRSIGPVPLGSVLPSNMTRIIESQQQQPQNNQLQYQQTQNNSNQTYSNPVDTNYSYSYKPSTYLNKSLPSAGINSVSSFGSTNLGSTQNTGSKLGATSGDLLGSVYGYEKTPYEKQQEEAMRLQAEYYNKLANDQTTEESARNDALRLMQAEVNAVDRVFADKISAQKEVGNQRLAMDRSINFNAGGTGSSFANASQSRAMNVNLADEAQIENEKLAALQAINSRAVQMGNQMFADKQNAKKLGVDAYLQAVNNQGALIEANTAKVANGMVNSGIDINTVPKEQLQSIASSLGTTPQRLIDTYNTAKSSVSVNKNIPASAQEYEYAKANGYTGSYNDYQNEDANRKAVASGSSTGGLTPSQINSTVNSIASALDNEPVVKEYNVIKNYVKPFNDYSKDSVGDQARIYAFAKVMDPNSAVKEGEYKTTEKYTQALLKAAGLKLGRVFSTGNILTEDARNRMYNVLNAKLKVNESAYKNVASEYQRQINDAYSGLPRQITNYSGSTNISQPITNDQIIKLRNSGISEERIQQYINSRSFNNVVSDTNQAVVIPQNIGNSKNQLAWRNNNPGNIRYVGQKGAVRGANGFAKFETPEAGFNELLSLVNRRQSQGHTVSSFINQYAPSFENNTNAYLTRIVRETGASPNTPLANVDPMAIARVIASHESGTKIYG